MKHFILIMTCAAILFAGCKKDNPQSPAALTTEDVTSVTSNTASTGGNITGDGGTAISKRGVCFATHPSPTVADSITADGAGTGAFTSSLTNLMAYTKYYVRAYAINATGTSYGDEVSFTTATGAPFVTTAAISNIVALKAQGGGNVIADGGSPVTVRGLCWSVSEHPTVNNFKIVDVAGGTGVFADSLSPLASQTMYYVRAFATNAFGTSYGNEVSFTANAADAIIDIDNNVYPTIVIGTQTWMRTNLKTAHYRNGDPITDGSANNGAFYKNGWFITNPPIDRPSTGAFAYPNNDANNNTVYGKYYDNLSMSDTRGICPTGWHIPTDEEWQTLLKFQGLPQSDLDVFGQFVGTIGSKLLVGGSSGLDLQLAGYLYLDNQAGPTYEPFGTGGIGQYWSSTFYNTIDLWSITFNLSGDPGQIYRSPISDVASSVRCLKN